jgi:flagellar FliJ protein
VATRFPLQALLDLAGERLEAAQRRLQALEGERRQSAARLEELEGYLAEYRERLAARLERGMDPPRLRDYRAFLERLGLACDQQREDLRVRETAWSAAREAWLEQRRRRRAYEALEQRHRANEARREARVDQRVQDDYAQRLLLERARAGDGEPG